jgi:hypothetical protein
MSLINDALKRAKKRTTVRPPQSSFSHDSLQPVGDRSQRIALEAKSMRSQPHTPWPWIVAALLALGLCLAIAGWFFGNAMALMRSAKPNPNPQTSSIESKQSPGVSESTPVSTASISAKEPESSRPGTPSERQSSYNASQKPTVVPVSPTSPTSPANATQELQAQENSAQSQALKDRSNTPAKDLAAAQQPVQPAERIEEQPAPDPIAKEPEIPVYFTSIPAEGEWPLLRLQGIFYDEDDPVALINNRDLLAGESIGQVEIVSIESKKVTLRLGTELKILQFRR